MKIFCLVGFFVFVTLASSAQSDFIVKLPNDTLYGEVRIQSYDQQDRIQLIANKKKENFKATQLAFVSIKGEIYKAQKLENSIRMMKLLKEGFLSIYAFKVENQSSFEGRMLVRKDGTSMEVPNLSFKKAMTAYLADCKTVSDMIKNGSYSRNDLEKIVDDYNTCMVSGSGEIASVKAKSEEQSTIQNEKTEMINDFTKKVAALDFESRKDALEILQDMQSKVSRNETIPNYQVEALKSLLAAQQSIQPDLEKLISVLKDKG
jgi:ribosomal protein S17E